MILVTGGAGFIGSNFVHRWLAESDEPVMNLDKLTSAGNLANLRAFQDDARHQFVQGDIGDRALIGPLLERHRPRAVINFAAESHVDRSIHGPAAFIVTNVDGTFGLLEAVRDYWSTLAEYERVPFRFLHVSTDEVYGTLEPRDAEFTESTPCRPNSPYAASKAASDHLVRRDLQHLRRKRTVEHRRRSHDLQPPRRAESASRGRNYVELISFVRDRPGHDRRYAVEASRIRLDLGWRPKETLESGLRKTARWYLDNQEWTDGVVSGHIAPGSISTTLAEAAVSSDSPPIKLTTVPHRRPAARTSRRSAARSTTSSRGTEYTPSAPAATR
jgi:dTDP-D-glucose 4,6-dehydratase